MKSFKSIFVVTLVMMASTVFADDTKYIEAMKKNIDRLYAAKTIPDLQNAVNALERIGSAEKSKWEPHYYAAFGYILMADKEKELPEKDSYLDLATKAVEKAKAINPNESEIVALEGFALMIRLSVDPASRGAQYSGAVMQLFGKAIGLNGSNPRALALMAQMQFGTARFFNSPTTEACASVASALEKFDTFKSENPIAPLWGKEMTEGLKKQCQ